jgi:hypothetical protein
MYSANGLWEDAMRVAKMFGGINGSKEVLHLFCFLFGHKNHALIVHVYVKTININA